MWQGKNKKTPPIKIHSCVTNKPSSAWEDLWKHWMENEKGTEVVVNHCPLWAGQDVSRSCGRQEVRLNRVAAPSEFMLQKSEIKQVWDTAKQQGAFLYHLDWKDPWCRLPAVKRHKHGANTAVSSGTASGQLIHQEHFITGIQCTWPQSRASPGIHGWEIYDTVK